MVFVLFVLIVIGQNDCTVTDVGVSADNVVDERTFVCCRLLEFVDV